MDPRDAKVVGLLGVSDGHGSSQAADVFKRNPSSEILLEPQALFSSNPTVAIGMRVQNLHLIAPVHHKGKLLVFNPSTGETRALLHPRTPVLVHLSSSRTSFEVIVAGSSTAIDEHRSRKVEVIDSVTSECTEACDVPGPFGLNEHQGGVICVDGIVLSIVFLESGGKGVVAFDGKWVTCAIPDYPSCNTLQLVAQNNGEVNLFSEREQDRPVEHCIDEPEFLTATRQCKNMKKPLQVYPEWKFGEGKLCIFNTLNRDGDIRNGETLLVKTSGHGDSPAADYAKQVCSTVLRFRKDYGMSIPQNILFAMAVVCLQAQRANAQQLTSNGNAIDLAAWLTSYTVAKGAFVTALFAGGLGAAFIWKRFFPTFSVDAGLKASPAELGRCRSDLDSIYPPLDECY